MVADPSRYFEYYHNLHVFNESLINYLDYKIDESDKFPGLYGNEIEKVKKSHFQALRVNEEADQYVRKYARIVYENCYRKHLNLTTLYDHSFLEFIEGNADQSVELAEKYIVACKEQNLDYQLNSTELMRLGQAYLELNQYMQAIEVLSDLIQKDPTNKDAYFHRSAAYFEIGNFDEALIDFAQSDQGKEIAKSKHHVSHDFKTALINSLCQGAAEATTEFVPSFCQSAYGLSQALWATAQHPLESTEKFANACYDIGKCTVDYCKNLDWETMEDYVEQIKTLYDRFDQLNDKEKGELIGYTVGKYGVDIFICTGAMKGVEAYRKLKNANRLCNLEAMTISNANKEAVIASSLKHAAERDAYFKKVTIHWDKQNKHISGKHNFQSDKGIISIESSKLETLVKDQAGKGQRVCGQLGEANFVERVDFGEIIGEYALCIKGEPTKYIPTSKATIRYAKDGKVHVVPSDPYAIIE